MTKAEMKAEMYDKVCDYVVDIEAMWGNYNGWAKKIGKPGYELNELDEMLMGRMFEEKIYIKRQTLIRP